MTNKILIITSSYDLTVDYIVEKYGKEHNFFRINTDKLSEYEVCIQNYNDFWQIKNKYKKIHSSELKAVYYRKPALPNLGAYEPHYHNLMAKEILTLIEGIVESCDRRCLSKPSVLKRADNKILQLKLAKEVGFDMPSSLITNSNISASCFIKKNINSIVKPLSTGRVTYNDKVGIIQTNLVDKNIELKNLELTPSYFQEYIEKQYELRVTIVNSKVYAVRIDTNEKIDWRKSKGNIKYSEFKLPVKIIKKCYALMQELNLKFGIFDFIINDRNDFYFLEVNANGQWGWLEQGLKLNISGEIIKYLMEAE